MPIEVRIILDSGFFRRTTGEQGDVFRVGYFDAAPSCPDVRVYADGEEVGISPILKLGTGNRTIDIEHLDQNGTRKTGVATSSNFDQFLLKLDSLYCETVQVDE